MSWRWWLGCPAVLAVVSVVMASPASAYVYWIEPNFDGGVSAIARADNNGSHVNRHFISTGTEDSTAIAVDGAHIYWTNDGDSGGPNSIGRADLDGSHVNQDFIATPNGDTTALAVDGSYIYWGNSGEAGPVYIPTSIGRANIDGSGVNQDLIPVTGGPDSPIGLAANSHFILLDLRLCWFRRRDWEGQSRRYVCQPKLYCYKQRLQHVV